MLKLCEASPVGVENETAQPFILHDPISTVKKYQIANQDRFIKRTSEKIESTVLAEPTENFRGYVGGSNQLFQASVTLRIPSAAPSVIFSVSYPT